RTGAALGRLAEDAGQPGAGVRDRRIHAFAQELRCARVRLLRPRQIDVRRPHAQRVQSGVAREALPALQGSGHGALSFYESARGQAWGQGLTAQKMAECKWLKPELVGQFEFVEWTPDNHLRHSRFQGLREDKKPRDVHWEG